jgi:hypothetical protein
MPVLKSVPCEAGYRAGSLASKQDGSVPASVPKSCLCKSSFQACSVQAAWFACWSWSLMLLYASVKFWNWSLLAWCSTWVC